MDDDAKDSQATEETEGAEGAEGTEGADEAQEHTKEEIAEIEAERERRLDPDNRPENAVIDNSDAELPTVKHFEELNAEDEEVEGQAGSSDPSQRFKDLEYSDEEIKEMEEERERRLDPDNRPDFTEVDNTGRTFEDGHFVDDGPEDADGDQDSSEDRDED